MVNIQEIHVWVLEEATNVVVSSLGLKKCITSLMEIVGPRNFKDLSLFTSERKRVWKKCLSFINSTEQKQTLQVYIILGFPRDQLLLSFSDKCLPVFWITPLNM